MKPKRQRNFLFVIFILFFLTGCATLRPAPAVKYIPAPAILPNTTQEMNSADFWISKHSSPEKVIMSKEQIADFNSTTCQVRHLSADLLSFGPTYSGKSLAKAFKSELSSIKGKKLLASSGQRIPDAFFNTMRDVMNMKNIPNNVPVQYGIMTQFANERVLPTDQGLYEKIDNLDFDELQNSGYDVGTPCVILYASQNGAWLYIMTELTSGWVKKDRVALCAKSDAEKFILKKNIAVAISPKVPLYSDKDCTAPFDFFRMGASLPFKAEASEGAYEVIIPTRSDDGSYAEGTGYVRKEDVNIGFLSYTPKTIMTQAFKMLGLPYGWGDSGAEQDCSRLIQEVFATVGVMMPRNSSAQGSVGISLGSFKDKTGTQDKLQALDNFGMGGVTIIQLKGHIMLYLGKASGNHYVIHATYGYREPGNTNNIVRTIKGVVVSDLSLGEGSRKGSLLDRIVSLRNVCW